MSKFVWTQQPQVPVEIDWSNPLVRGLVVVMSPLAWLNLANNNALTLNNAPKSTTPQGIAFTFSSSATVRTQAAMPVSAGDITLFVDVIPTSIVQGVFFGVFNVNAAINNDSGHFISVEADGKINAVSTSASNWVMAVGISPTANKRYRLAATFVSGGGRTLFIDGVQSATNATARTVTGLTHALANAYAFNSGTYQSPEPSKQVIQLVWNRALSAAEVASISTNPWQIFKPQNRPTFTDLPSYYETVGSIQRTYHTRTSQPQVSTDLNSEFFAYKPKTIVNFSNNKAYISGTTAPIYINSDTVPTPYGISRSDFTSSNFTPVGEICHPPQTTIALVYIKNLPGSGSFDVVGFSGGGDTNKFYASPYSWTWTLQRNYTGPIIVVSGSTTPCQPTIGKLFLLVARSDSNTSHKFEVWRLDNKAYEVNTATTDTSAVSFIDAMPFKISTFNYGFPLLFGIFDEYIPDSVISNLVSNPWQIFAPDARTMLSQFTYNPPVGGGDTSYSLSIGDATAQGVNTALDYDFYTANVADAAATGVNAFIGSTIDCSIADASAEGIIYSLDKYIDLSVADAAAEGTAYYNDYSIPTSIADASAQGINLYQDIDNALTIGNANAEGITYNLDKSIDLSVGDAAAEGVAYAGGSSIDCGVGDASAAGTPYYNDYSVYCGVANSDAQGITLSSDISLVLSMADAVATGESLLQDRSIPLSVANASAEGTAYIPDYGIDCQVADAVASGQPIQNQIDMYCQTANASAEGITCSIGLTAMEYDPAYKYVFSPSGKYFTLSPVSRNNTLTSGNRVQIQASGNRSYTFIVPKPQTNFIRN